jgi:hypothetical protein
MDQRSLRLLGIACWLLAVACAAVVFWLAFGVASPAKESAAKAHQELTREHTQSEAVISHALAAAMFAGDYSEAQDLLTRYAATGYFTRAVVTNSAQRVVASVGSTPGLAVGKPLPDSTAAGGREVKLLLRSEDYGKLVVLEAQQSAAAVALETRVGTLYNALRALAWAALVLA